MPCPAVSAALLLLMSAVTVSAFDCPGADWKPYEETCFTHLPLLFIGRDEAAAACQAAQPGATLPSVHSTEQNWFLQNLSPERQYTDIWLGLSRVNSSQLQWDDGSPVDFTNWLGAEPDSTGNCVYMDFFTAKWRDISCATTYFYVVCQYTP